MSEGPIERFYAAFARRDGTAMAACYAPDARFSDPVFGKLQAEEAGAMWRMLTGGAQELEVELLEHTDHGEWGTARWRASYVFTQTGRPVVNEVFAAFRLDDGLIAEHADSFSFKAWAAQALGRHARVPGALRVLRAAVRRRARRRLQEFMAGERDAAPAGQLPATPRPEPGAP
jgi:ketosteroid isomerase-like protein